MISDKNILASRQGQVTFSYINSETNKTETQTLPGEDFLWRVLQHVLPKRFCRSRGCGFLHSNAKKQLRLVQLILNVAVPVLEKITRPVFKCKQCGDSMKHIAFHFMRPIDPNQPKARTRQDQEQNYPTWIAEARCEVFWNEKPMLPISEPAKNSKLKS